MIQKFYLKFRVIFLCINIYFSIFNLKLIKRNYKLLKYRSINSKLKKYNK